MELLCEGLLLSFVAWALIGLRDFQRRTETTTTKYEKSQFTRILAPLKRSRAVKKAFVLTHTSTQTGSSCPLAGQGVSEGVGLISPKHSLQLSPLRSSPRGARTTKHGKNVKNARLLLPASNPPPPPLPHPSSWGY